MNSILSSDALQVASRFRSPYSVDLAQVDTISQIVALKTASLVLVIQLAPLSHSVAILVITGQETSVTNAPVILYVQVAGIPVEKDMNP